MISRDDLETKLREIQGAIAVTTEGVKSTGVYIASGVALLAVTGLVMWRAMR